MQAEAVTKGRMLTALLDQYYAVIKARLAPIPRISYCPKIDVRLASCNVAHLVMCEHVFKAHPPAVLGGKTLDRSGFSLREIFLQGKLGPVSMLILFSSDDPGS